MSIYFTQQGLDALKRKEQKLSEALSSSGIEVGAEAGLNCDWHDNAGYDEAKRALELNSIRLGEVRDSLRTAIVFTLSEQADAVRIGSTVQITLVDKGGEEEVKEFTIGAYAETDANSGLIAYDSPMASVLMTHEAGDTLENVSIGNKVVDIMINKILPPSAKYIKLAAKFYKMNE